MKRTVRRLLGGGILLLFLACCALLPTALAWIQDLRQLDAVRTVKMKPISADSGAQYSLLQRFQLGSGEYQLNEDIQIMSFNTGIHFNQTSAIQNMRAQIDTLHEAGLLPMDSAALADYDVQAIEYGADTTQPACSLMVWTVGASSPDSAYTLEMHMDDESGLAIRLWCILGGANTAWSDELNLSACAKAWAEYLGATLKEEYETYDRFAWNAEREYLGITLTDEDQTLSRTKSKKDSRASYVDLSDSNGAGLEKSSDKTTTRALNVTLSDDAAELTYQILCTENEFFIELV